MSYVGVVLVYVRLFGVVQVVVWGVVLVVVRVVVVVTVRASLARLHRVQRP